MAKRRTKEQLRSDRIIKKELIILKDKILDEAYPITRVDTSVLREEMNGRVIKDTTLVMAQKKYGAYNYPIGKDSGEKNTLLIAMTDLIPNATKRIIVNLNDIMLKDFKK